MSPEQFMQSWRIRGTDKSSTVYRLGQECPVDGFKTFNLVANEGAHV